MKTYLSRTYSHSNKGSSKVKRKYY